MNIYRTSGLIEGSHGRRMLYDLRVPDKGRSIIVFSHGFKGFKDWGHFNLIADTFAQRGFAFMKFNYSHNGTNSDNPLDFVDLEAFGQNNFSIEQEDLRQVIDFVYQETSLDGLKENLTLIGHSRGGAASIIRTANDNRIKALITWASISAYGRYWNEKLMAKWEQDGVMYVRNGRTNQDMPMYWQLYEDYFANHKKLDVQAATKSIDQPFLICHAKDDKAVDVKAAMDIKASNATATLFLTEGGGHTFGGKHPWNSHELPEETADVVGVSIDFLNKLFGSN